MTTYRRGRDEVTVGLFALGAVTIFAILFGGLTSRGIIRHASDLYVVLPTAEGLLKGDAVLFRGVPVGVVRSIDFVEHGGVMVRATLRRRVPLAQDASAALTPVDMFGRQSIVLREGGAAFGVPALAHGDTIQGHPPRPLTERVTDMGRQVERLLNDTTLVLVRAALEGIGSAGGGLAVAGAEVTSLVATQRQTMDHVGAATLTVARNLAAATDSAELALLRDELRLAVHSLARATARMDSAAGSAASLFAKLDRGEGSLGRLIHDDQLYERVTGAVLALEQLAVDVRRDPRRYISLKVF